MIYVTHCYELHKFETANEAMKFILKDLDNRYPYYRAVFDEVTTGVRVIVFQYDTLYMETYIIHEKIDIRRI